MPSHCEHAADMLIPPEQYVKILCYESVYYKGEPENSVPLLFAVIRQRGMKPMGGGVAC